MTLKFWMLKNGETGIGNPADAFWEWELAPFTDEMGTADLQVLQRGAAIFIPDLVRSACETEFCGKTGPCGKCADLPHCFQAGLPPVFDDEYAAARFQFPANAGKIRERLGRLQADWVIGRNRVRETMETLSSRMDAVRDIELRIMRGVNPENYLRRAFSLMTENAMAVYRPLADFSAGELRRQKAMLDCPVKVSRSCREFSENWREKWEVFYLKDAVFSDSFGPLRGIVNLDTGKFAEAARVFEGLGKKRSDRRTSPFEHIKIRWPADFSDRGEIMQIIRLVLSLRGMPDNPAMWTVSRKKGNPYCLHICVCRVPLCPDESGKRPVLGSSVPESLEMIREKIAERLKD